MIFLFLFLNITIVSGWLKYIYSKELHWGLFYQLQTMCNTILLYSVRVTLSQLCSQPTHHPHSWVHTRASRLSRTNTHIFIPLNCCWCVWAVCPGWCHCRDDAAGWSAGRFWGGTSLTRYAGKGPGRRCWRSSRPPTTTKTHRYMQKFASNLRRRAAGDPWMRSSLKLKPSNETNFYYYFLLWLKLWLICWRKSRKQISPHNGSVSSQFKSNTWQKRLSVTQVIDFDLIWWSNMLQLTPFYLQVQFTQIPSTLNGI